MNESGLHPPKETPPWCMQCKKFIDGYKHYYALSLRCLGQLLWYVGVPIIIFIIYIEREKIFEFLTGNDFPAPVVQFIAAVFALLSVLIANLFLHKRSEKDIKARFEMIEKEHQYKKAAESRKERFQKAEEIFAIIHELMVEMKGVSSSCEKVRDILSSNDNEEISEVVKGFFLENKKLLQSCVFKRLKVQLFIGIYERDLVKFFDEWICKEDVFNSCFISFETELRLRKSYENVNILYFHDVYIDFLRYLEESVKLLSNFLRE